MYVKHNERCKECNKRIFELLSKLFGEVKTNYNLNLSNKPDSFKKNPFSSDLKNIFFSLQNYRDFDNFVRTKKLPNVDFYVVNPGFIVEFDESQHFTKPREITLENYPNGLKLGFNKQKWTKLCVDLHKKDNDPPFRDEQRAWYDTLRDFSPFILNLKPTIRLFAKDYIWCNLNPDSDRDLNRFKNFLNIKTLNYKITIVKNHPEYIGKNLLLTNMSKNRLFKENGRFYIEIEINDYGELFVHKVSETLKRERINVSLRKIGETYLGLKDPSVNQMLKHFVTPEMEIERIFNNLRYKYLNSIYLSGFGNPQQLINAKYNQAFQSLAGIKVYQGNTNERKSNDYFWKNAGFKQGYKLKNDFEAEREDLRFILYYIRSLDIDNFNKIYAELIAIKPGFHELLIHYDYFDKESIPSGKDIRTQVFRLLRGIGSLSDIKLNKLPHEINGKSFFSYASCNITEGPFVLKKKIPTSYFDEIRKIKSKEQIHNLKDKFIILDYYHNNLNTKEKLAQFLTKAEKFRYFA